MKNVFLLFFCALSFSAFTQNITSEGTDFWFAFPNHYDDNNFPANQYASFDLIISTRNNGVTGSVQITGGATQAFALNSTATTRVNLNALQATISSSGVVENKAIHITSNKSISVYAIYYGPTRMEASLILPVHLLGTDYTVLTEASEYFEYGNGNTAHMPSQAVIVSSGNTATVEVTPSCNIENGPNAGVTQTYTLNSGQVLQLKARNGTTGAAGDISGTKIRTTNGANIAVYAGHKQKAIYGPQHSDPIFEVQYPSQFAGEEYIYIPSAFAPNFDKVRVVAINDGTVISVNGTPVATLNAGQVYENQMNAASTIQGSDKILVGSFMPSGAANGNAYIDPSMLTLCSNDQMFIDTISFASPYMNGAITSSYLEVITRTTDVNSIKLDGTLLNGFTTLPSNGEYSYKVVPISDDEHSLTTDGCGFLAYVKSAGHATSYSYAAGVSFQVPTTPDLTVTNTDKGSTTLFCLGDNIALEAENLNYTPSNYNWTIGDPDNPVYEESGANLNPLNYTFTTTGTFDIRIILEYQCHDNDTLYNQVFIPALTPVAMNDTLLCESELPFDLDLGSLATGDDLNFEWNTGASSSAISIPSAGDYWFRVFNSCAASDTTKFTVTTRPALNITPLEDTLVCGSFDPVEFTAQGDGGTVTYNWENQGYSADPLFTANTEGTYEVQIANECDTLTDDVTISLLPGLTITPLRDTLVCPDFDPVVFTALGSTNAPGDITYNWENQGYSTDGTFSAQTSGTFNVSIASICDTLTDDVEISLAPDLQVEPLTDSTVCPGIGVTYTPVIISGGTISYLWSDNSTEANNTYDATGAHYVEISDECQDTTLNFNLNVHPELEITPMADVEICSWGDTLLTAQATAGAGTLEYAWNDASTAASLNATAAGTYWVDISDDCSTIRDSVDVIVVVDIQYNPLSDLTLCPNSSGILKAEDNLVNPDELGTVNFLWHDSETTGFHSVASSGIYWVDIMTVCDTIRDSINVVFTPELILPPVTDLKLCEGESENVDVTALQFSDPITYTWQDGDANSIKTINTEGQYSVTVKDGCTEEILQFDVEVVPDIQLAPLLNDTICPGEQTSFFIEDPTRDDLVYLWNNTLTANEFTTGQAGSYFVQVSDTSNCHVHRDTVDVIVPDPLPELPLVDTTLCPDTELQINLIHLALPVTQWTHLDGNNPSISIQDAGSYKLIISDGFCFDSVEFDVAVRERPFVSLEDHNICSDSSIVLIPEYTGPEDVNFDWSTGYTSRNLPVNEAGEYELIVTDLFCPGSADSALSVVTTMPCESNFFVPNAFTPNGDGINDDFFAVSTNEITEFQLLIFDRWGELIFLSTDINSGWNGRSMRSGTDCQIDVYPWRIEYSYINYRTGGNEEQVSLKGHVSIVK